MHLKTLNLPFTNSLRVLLKHAFVSKYNNWFKVSNYTTSMHHWLERLKPTWPCIASLRQLGSKTLIPGINQWKSLAVTDTMGSNCLESSIWGICAGGARKILSQKFADVIGTGDPQLILGEFSTNHIWQLLRQAFPSSLCWSCYQQHFSILNSLKWLAQPETKSHISRRNSSHTSWHQSDINCVVGSIQSFFPHKFPPVPGHCCVFLGLGNLFFLLAAKCAQKILLSEKKV